MFLKINVIRGVENIIGILQIFQIFWGNQESGY